MATTFVEYTGDGNATKQFTFPSYQESDVKVRVDGVLKTTSTHYNITGYTTTGGGNVVFTSGNIPSSPAKIRIYRDTSVDVAKATYTAGSSVKAADLNNNNTQLLYRAQEEQAPNLIQSYDIDAGAVETSNIKADAITGAKIADDQIDSEHYVDGSIDTAHIGDSQVTTAKIADANITHVKLANDCIDSDNIQDDVINSEHYAATSIDTEHIANENITTAKLANSSVTSAKLATDAVTTAKIVDSNVTTAKIADDAVTTDKLANSINAEIAANTAKITNQTHTGEVTGATSLTIANNAVTTAKIAADAVTGAKIPDDAIDSEHYTDGSIDTIHIGDSQITTAKIADGAITDAKIAGGSLDNRYYTETELDAGQLDNRYYTETELNAGQLDNRYFTETELTNGALDGRYFTEAEADARYFNISTGDTIKDGDTFPDNDTTIATTAAINDRIIDLVDDVGGFVPIASETAFPSANPDVNNGSGTLVSIKAIGSTRTPSSGTVTIANGSGSNTVTITGCGSTVLTAGFGVIVETTSTLHTYAFHRLVPKATEVTTVAGISSNITTVATNTSNINAVANDTTDIGTVAGAITNVNNVGGSISNVNTVASNISNVNAVANDATDIGAVAAKATEIGRLGTADAVADMNTLGTSAIVSDMDTLADISSNISTVAGISSNVTTVAGIQGNVTTVAGISGNVTAVANDATDIGTVAGSISNVNTVAGANSNITTVANANSNISTVAGANSNISTVAGSISNVNTVGNNISNVNNFANRYRIASSAPSSNNDAGDLYFDTSSNELRVYNGSAWQGGVTATGNLAGLGANTFTGNQTIQSTHPKLLLTDTNANSDFSVHVNDGAWHVRDETNNTNRIEIQSDGTVDIIGNLDAQGGVDVTGNITVSGNVDGRDVAADGTKLDGIDTNASSFANLVEDTSPQLGGDLDMNGNSISSGTLNIKNTGSQSEVRLFCEVSNAHYVSIKAPAHSAYSGNITYTLPPTATNGQYIKTDANGNLSFAAPTENDFTTTLKNKLDGIEASATADQTASEIRTLVESASDSNVFTDADHSKLNGIESGATGDQTNAEIRAAVEAASDSNVFTDADHSKLNGIEASADVTDATNVDAAGAVMNSDSTTASMSFVVDEDNMSSNSATKVPTQQSVKAYVDAEVAGVVDSAPGALNTLNELAAALGDDASFSTTVTNSIATKLPLAGGTMTGNIVMSGSQTVDGRDLSVDGAKLDGIASSANNYSHPNHSGEVTSSGDGAMTIADNVVDEANLKVSNSPTNGYFLSAQSGNTGGLTWAQVNTDLVNDTSPQLGNALDCQTHNISLSDSSGTASGRIRWGNSQDLQIYHQNTNSFIENTEGALYLSTVTGSIQINKSSAENMAKFIVDGAVELYHDNSKKFETTSSGVTVTGDVYSSTGVFGEGSSNNIDFTTDNRMAIHINGSEEFRFESDGDFHADGDVIAFSTTVSSDERLKENIEIVPDALDKVEALRGVTFDWKRDGKSSAGVIAQEVMGVLPEAVKEVQGLNDKESHLTVNYHALTSILIEAIKDLSAKVKVLEAK